MAEYVTKAENTRRLVIIALCVILDTLLLAGGIYWIKSASDTERGEKNSESIVLLQKKVQDLDAQNRAAEKGLIEFAQPIGWRTHANWTTDRLVTGALNAEELKRFLNEWAAELRGRAPKEGERESMKYAFLRRLKTLLDGAERQPGFPGLKNLQRSAEDREKSAASEGERKFWQGEAATLKTCVEAVDAGGKKVEPTPELPVWTDRAEGMVLKKLFEELEKLEVAYLAVAVALGKRLEKASEGEKELVKEGRVQSDEAHKKLLSTIDDLIGADRGNKSFTSKDLPGGLLGELRDSEGKGPKNEAEKEVELKAVLAEVAEARQRLDQLKAENALKEKDLQARINWFKHRREEAKERREPDGEIVGVVEGQQTVHIDLLHKDRLFVGTRFRVYSPKQGGVKVDKAEIEVIEVRESGASVAAVTRILNSSDAVRAGDRIYNEVYERGRPRYIAIAGRLTGRLSNEEVAAIVRRFGDHYQDRVDQRTDFLVVGEGYDGSDHRAGTTETDEGAEDDHPNFTLAREWGVRVIRERTLFEYLGVK